jgi:hypothetical protein
MRYGRFQNKSESGHYDNTIQNSMYLVQNRLCIMPAQIDPGTIDPGTKILCTCIGTCEGECCTVCTYEYVGLDYRMNFAKEWMQVAETMYYYIL